MSFSRSLTSLASFALVLALVAWAEAGFPPAQGVGGAALGGVTVTGTPSANQVVTATSGTAATWQTPTQWTNASYLDGSDGAASFSGGAVTGASLSGSTYTLTRSVYYTTAVVANGYTVATGGYRGYCTVSLVVQNGGTIQNNGGNASVSTGGAASAGASGGTFAVLRAGSAGGSGRITGGTGAGSSSSATVSGYSDGGRGGSGGAAGSSGGTAAAPSASTYDFPLREVATVFDGCTLGVALQGAAGAGSNVQGAMCGGTGGGGGANGNAAGYGGGGGGAGGVVWWSAPLVQVDVGGTIRAIGGNGADGSGAAGGGGGSGGGGVIVLRCRTYTDNGTVSVAAGTHGSGSGTGSVGVDGSPGTIYVIQGG